MLCVHIHLGMQFVLENWMMNHHISAVRTYCETKSTIWTQRHFWCEFDVLWQWYSTGGTQSHPKILFFVI
jgi:hypothetical protein